MVDECNHKAASLIDVTVMGDDRYHYLCIRCGAVVVGYPIAPVNPATAKQQEQENERKVKEWATLAD